MLVIIDWKIAFLSIESAKIDRSIEPVKQALGVKIMSGYEKKSGFG
ncbi:MAG: hypothetical protein R3E36_04630 [Nitrosomonas sp.]|nr:hypothetical protein [Nitrosomonas sp.]MCP5292212.1 hypothetical protein [Burkholderiales bacterium]MDR4519876.1 hypothetical protein [Nitrosomonas sp.]